MSDGLFAVIVETKHFQRWQMWLGLLCSSQLLLYKPSALQHRLSRSAGWHQHLNQACKWANEVLPSLLSAQQQEVSALSTHLVTAAPAWFVGRLGVTELAEAVLWGVQSLAAALRGRNEGTCSLMCESWWHLHEQVKTCPAVMSCSGFLCSDGFMFEHLLQEHFRSPHDWILNTFYIFKLHLKSDSWEEI